MALGVLPNMTKILVNAYKLLFFWRTINNENENTHKEKWFHVNRIASGHFNNRFIDSDSDAGFE